MSPASSVEISAVMPAFNEEGNLEQSVGRMAAALADQARAFEVIVVDDGRLARDVNCAFKLIRRDLLARMELHSEGALINTEVFVLARQLHARVVEVPVQHYPRTSGRQTGANLRVVFRAFSELLAFKAEMRKVEKAA